ncbi:dihydrolipoyl dehydrogenase [Domibacillus iocasae]|uniref:Dihydrolipoyl dehydrogenase n=1 Tax=Domibacillus iocasae TaxID=1714016 RepID=A0A1E7DN25_9BACI|nr:dihydrolipoyl dehydrogenase [Domibacillus iocasae]OES44415.1 dihydrolipoyl dehydrogenase [Domibacillus iocasae]
MATAYDLVIVGGGIGGYTAAIRASQLGLKTAIVEQDKLGGTCLHKGCIPTKALLRSAEVYRTVKESAAFGIEANKAELHFSRVQERKENIVHTLYNGVQSLMKKGKIDVYEGTGRLMGPSLFSPIAGTISVQMNDGTENVMLIPKHVIIATGSRPKTLTGLEPDGEMILSSNEALELKKIPASIIIVGGGVIGVEWASMLADLGSKVTILEYGNRILPFEDEEISKEMARQLIKRRIQIVVNAEIKPEMLKKESSTVSVQTTAGEIYSAEKLLVAAGRTANTEQIGLENTEIKVENGVIQVNEWMQTNESHIYAIGDVVGGLQLAHVASYEGTTAVEHIAGKASDPVDYSFVPRCMYAYPEAASVGITERQAVLEGIEVKTGKFPFQAIGKALVYGETEGFVKVVSDARTDDVLGVHIIGPHATELISEAALARMLHASGWELGTMIHPHPSLSEAVGEAALMMSGKAIHF